MQKSSQEGPSVQLCGCVLPKPGASYTKTTVHTAALQVCSTAAAYGGPKKRELEFRLAGGGPVTPNVDDRVGKSQLG